MKKLFFAGALMLACFTTKIANAQVSLSLNIGSQPEWGPVGYDHADYYYMPDIDAYYDVTNHLYVYNENNVWVHRAYLPERYHFDKYNTYKVVVNERNPWERHAEIRARYAAYKGRRDQAIIRDSREERYRNHYREVAVRNHQAAVRNNRVSHRNAEVAKRNHQVAVRNARESQHLKKEERREQRH